jgi:hypothetical protein
VSSSADFFDALVACRSDLRDFVSLFLALRCLVAFAAGSADVSAALPTAAAGSDAGASFSVA